jgi:XapX domain-containing protein
MKPYLLSLGAGLLVGVLYAMMGVRSPAPPVIALLGLLGMLVGEQAVPIAKRLMTRASVVAYLKTPECAGQVLGPQAIGGEVPDPKREQACGRAAAGRG